MYVLKVGNSVANDSSCGRGALPSLTGHLLPLVATANWSIATVGHNLQPPLQATAAGLHHCPPPPMTTPTAASGHHRQSLLPANTASRRLQPPLSTKKEEVICP
ncbi:hypothetical protein KFK09_018800 [Dendrobium nobile]|uniref:Uncharacterized protein n=1 Tax=Dendrobium nobile TaxID=94219 RepID=A0A8T3AVD9_DENNO|nr:hypothetical protein KFK09_018800 [Dendrobium nobile]